MAVFAFKEALQVSFYSDVPQGSIFGPNLYTLPHEKALITASLPHFAGNIRLYLLKLTVLHTPTRTSTFLDPDSRDGDSSFRFDFDLHTEDSRLDSNL